MIQKCIRKDINVPKLTIFNGEKTTSALEITEIIVLTVIINVCVTVVLFRIAIWKLGLQRYLRMASQYASMMGQKSGEVRHNRVVKRMNVQTKKKIADAAIEELPGGEILKRVISRANISPDEIFNLIQDENFMKGVVIIIKTFGGFMNKITGKGEEKSGEQNLNNQQLY